MKKIVLVAAVACLALSSCKKDYTCTCKDQDTPPFDDVVITYTNVKKKDAQNACNAANTTYSAANYKCTLN